MDFNGEIKRNVTLVTGTSRNALGDTDSIDSGRSMSETFVHPLNTYAPMSLRPIGNTTFVTLEKF